MRELIKQGGIKKRLHDLLFSLAVILAALIFIALIFAFALPFFEAIIKPLFAKTNSTDLPSAFYIAKTILFTFSQSVCSVALAILVAMPGAFFLANRNFAGKKILASFSAVPLCIPALITALGYISVFGMSGIYNKILMGIFKLNEPPLTFIYSFWGIVICQGFYNFPLIMVTVARLWQKLGTDEEDSARLLGAGNVKIFFTVTLWKIMSALISSCIPVFLFCFFSFMIVELFGTTGGTTLESAIYHCARSSLNFKNAAILSLVETLSAFLILVFYSLMENKSEKIQGLNFLSEQKQKKALQRREIFPFSFYSLIVILFFVLPYFLIMFSSFTMSKDGSYIFTFKNWIFLFKSKNFISSIKNTFLTGTGTSFLCTAAAVFYSLFLSSISVSDRMKMFLKIIPVLPMAVSSVVMGIGMAGLVHRGNIVTLIISQSTLFWPFAFRQVWSQVQKIKSEVLEAAKMFSSKKSYLAFKIIIPQTKNAIISAALFSFAFSAGDASLPLVLSLQRFNTLSLLTYRLASSYRFGEACASGMLLGILCMALFALGSETQTKKRG